MQLERPTIFPNFLLVITIVFWTAVFVAYHDDITAFFSSSCGGG
jgi:hypothetical protein